MSFEASYRGEHTGYEILRQCSFINTDVAMKYLELIHFHEVRIVLSGKLAHSSGLSDLSRTSKQQGLLMIGKRSF